MKIPHCFSTGLSVGLFALATVLPASATDLYVSTTGLDSNNGTSAATPVLTLTRLRAVIQTLNGTGQPDDIVAHFAPGDYVLSSTEFFGVADSGGNGHQIIYRSDGGPGKAAIVGVDTLANQGHTWSLVPGSTTVWQTTLATGLTIPAIYESGKPAWLARLPKRNPIPRFPLAQSGYAFSLTGSGPDGGSDFLDFKPSDFPGIGVWNLSAAQVQWWKGPSVVSGTTVTTYVDWGMEQPDAAGSLSVGATADQLVIAHPTSYSPLLGERFYLQNVPDLLSAQGEFYYNSGSGVLQYCPRAADPNLVDIRVPLLTELLNLEGTTDPVTKLPTANIHNLTFDGLKFAYTALEPSGPASQVFRGAVLVATADHFTFTNCEFTAVGESALFFSNENALHTVTNCWIHDCGIGGIWIVNSIGSRGTTSPYPSTGHTISNCLIHDIGDIEPNAVWTAGVFLDSVDSSTVSNCEIFNSPRYATSLRGQYTTQSKKLIDSGKYLSFNNTFEYLRVHDCMMDSGDGGAVHAAGVNSTNDHTAGKDNINTWKQLLISGCYADASMMGIPPDGMFFDYPNETVLQRLSDIKIDFTADMAAGVGGKGFRTNKNGNKWLGTPDGTELGETMTNISWGLDSGGVAFNDSLMEYANIGLTADFPRAAFSLLPNYPEGFFDRTVVVDDETSDFAFSGAWGLSLAPGLKFGDGQYHAASSGADYAEWRPTLPWVGPYQIFAWQIPGIAGASSAAPFTVHPSSGSVSPSAPTVNQLVGVTVPQWVLLAACNFSAGRGTTNGYVRLNTVGGAAVRADALKFVYQGSTGFALGGEAGWWQFDGNLNDNSGNGFNAAADGTVGYSSSIKAAGADSLQLDGSTNFAFVADHPALDIGASTFAISLWFYDTASGSSNHHILMKGAGYDAQAGYQVSATDQNVSFVVGDGAHRVTVTAPHAGTNVWNHLVVNLDQGAGTITLYVNGALAASGSTSTLTGSLSNSSLNLDFGGNSGTPDWFGGLDEIRIYQRTLTSAEIQSLYRP